MKTSDFYYELPDELIAQTPAERRDASRLLVMDRRTGAATTDVFSNLGAHLRRGDLLVANDSRVLPARLIGVRPTGGTAELVLLKQVEGDVWECLARPGRKLREGAAVNFGGGTLRAVVQSVQQDGNRIVRFYYDGIFMEVLERLGEMPLPPYIKQRLADPERYQTVYAKAPGSAAAPTAGLHFTPELLSALEEQGVEVSYVTLHVGLGTFRPVSAGEVENHHMHSEFCEVPETTAADVTRARAEGRRVVCVGTTSCRVLESCAGEDGSLAPQSKWTDIFIYPGYKFKAVDGLITNFHLPESTLVMLVSAFAGRENVLRAYETAVRERMRFFSFGDAMLVI